MKLKLDKIKLAYPTALLPKENQDTKKNVFVGFGLWSKSHGLTTGLPIDILGMIITADQIRNQLDKTGTIYIYVADNLALEARTDNPDILEEDIITKRDQIIQRTNELCTWLHIENVVIEDSRALTNSPTYQEIVRAVKASHSNSRIPELEPTTENYVLKQTALIGFYQSERNCAAKISWCFDEKIIPNESTQIIQKGLANKNFDELWFDAFYQLYLGQSHPIGFIYTHPGISLEKSTKNTCAPYFAKNQESHPRVLFGDSLETLTGTESTPGKIERRTTIGPSKKKGAPKTEDPVVEFRYQLPPKFKKFMLTLLQELKTNYDVQIKSRKEESNPSVIIQDLAQVAGLSKSLIHEANKEQQVEAQTEQLSDFNSQFAFFNKSQSVPAITNSQGVNDHYEYNCNLNL